MDRNFVIDLDLEESIKLIKAVRFAVHHCTSGRVSSEAEPLDFPVFKSAGKDVLRLIEGFLGFEQADVPDQMTLFRDDGSAFLVVMTHERRMRLYLKSKELELWTGLVESKTSTPVSHPSQQEAFA